MRNIYMMEDVDTFYISASSLIRGSVAELAKHLPGSWHLGHDWTRYFSDKLRPSNDILAHLDLEGAVGADYFIFLDSEHFSRGGMMEYGARLRAGGTVHHIGCQDRGYMFFEVNNVIHYDSVEEFLECLNKRI